MSFLQIIVNREYRSNPSRRYSVRLNNIDLEQTKQFEEEMVCPPPWNNLSAYPRTYLPSEADKPPTHPTPRTHTHTHTHTERERERERETCRQTDRQTDTGMHGLAFKRALV